MGQTTNIEQAIIDDLTGLLVAFGIDNVYAWREDLGEIDAPTFVTVSPVMRGDAFSGANGGPSGYFIFDVEIACHSYVLDDADGATLRELTGEVRAVVLDADFVEDLNDASENITFHGWEMNSTIPGGDGAWRSNAISITLWLNPINAVEAATTTTTETEGE